MTRNSPGNNHPEWTVGTGATWIQTQANDEETHFERSGLDGDRREGREQAPIMRPKG